MLGKSAYLFSDKSLSSYFKIFYAKQGHAAIIVHYQNPNFVKHFVALLYHYAVRLVECVIRNGQSFFILLSTSQYLQKKVAKLS